MSNSTQRFSDRVENYVKYRPDYPAQVIELLRSECGLAPHSIVADIGSGTGIFARLLLATGCSVYGIEPNAPMRKAAENLLVGYDAFVSVDATAEATTLPDNSVHLITCAQAFHWFDLALCKREFSRLLQPGGFIVLLWNERRVEATSFLRGYEQLLLDFATDYEQVNHTQIDDAVLKDFYAPRGFSKRTFENRQWFDYDGLEGRLLSSSYTPGPGHPNYRPMLHALRGLFEAHQQNGKVSFDYDTNIYWSAP
ncbi:MAG TPA: class I SAM-dependent methyltransferase [Abditibacteriaceae bacterium]